MKMILGIVFTLLWTVWALVLYLEAARDFRDRFWLCFRTATIGFIPIIIGMVGLIIDSGGFLVVAVSIELTLLILYPILVIDEI